MTTVKRAQPPVLKKETTKPFVISGYTYRYDNNRGYYERRAKGSKDFEKCTPKILDQLAHDMAHGICDKIEKGLRKSFNSKPEHL